MADQTTQSILVAAPAATVMAVIADFPAYPEWAAAVKSATVVAEGAGGRAERVAFVLDAGVVKDSYELRYDWAPDGTRVSWELVSGQIQRAQQGSYRLVESDGRTEVTYCLAVDLAIPMIGMFKRKAQKMITDTALRELKRRVEGAGPRG